MKFNFSSFFQMLFNRENNAETVFDSAWSGNLYYCGSQKTCVLEINVSGPSLIPSLMIKSANLSIT